MIKTSQLFCSIPCGISFHPGRNYVPMSSPKSHNNGIDHLGNSSSIHPWVALRSTVKPTVREQLVNKVLLAISLREIAGAALRSLCVELRTK